MAVIPVALAGRSYDVIVDANLLEQAGTIVAPFLRQREFSLVADRNAWALHGARLEAGLAASGRSAAVYLVEPGESSKSWDSLARLTDWLLAQGVERGDHVVAFGGQQGQGKQGLLHKVLASLVLIGPAAVAHIGGSVPPLGTGSIQTVAKPVLNCEPQGPETTCEVQGRPGQGCQPAS